MSVFTIDVARSEVISVETGISEFITIESTSEEIVIDFAARGAQGPKGETGDSGIYAEAADFDLVARINNRYITE